ncbi:MAG: hypothetical protein DRJ10_02590 [Bacteroidetes bacterium]|nr:MAG: hypothetical protein DRJ10_02590 [Bacteroidota bacterium]
MFNRKTILAFVLVFVVLMTFLALGSFDYNFSHSIINTDSLWANFFNQFGEIPAILLMLIGTTILFGARKKDILWRNILSPVLALPFIALFSYVITSMPVRYMYENHATGFGEDIPQVLNITTIILAIIIFVTTMFIERKIDDSKFKEMRKAAILFILLVVGEIILVTVVKEVWGRPRMRILESIDGFKRWYEINGPALNNNYKSFPSGHTSNAFSVIAYTLFFSYFKNVNKKLVMIIAVIWGVLVAVSRVVLGAHFLSDVITGGYITIFLFIILTILIFRYPKKGKFNNKATSE